MPPPYPNRSEIEVAVSGLIPVTWISNSASRAASSRRSATLSEWVKFLDLFSRADSARSPGTLSGEVDRRQAGQGACAP